MNKYTVLTSDKRYELNVYCEKGKKGSIIIKEVKNKEKHRMFINGKKLN